MPSEAVCSQCDLGRVFTAGVPGIAPENPVSAFAASANRAVFFHCFDKIGAARWREAAIRPQPGAEKNLIQSHQANQNKSGDSDDFSDDGFHQRFRSAKFAFMCLEFRSEFYAQSLQKAFSKTF